MSDRCETCGWWDPPPKDENQNWGMCQFTPPGEMPEDASIAILATGRCSKHTAVQRRRDLVMLAGQALTGLAGSHYEHLVPQKDIAHDCLAQADAILEWTEADDNG